MLRDSLSWCLMHSWTQHWGNSIQENTHIITYTVWWLLFNLGLKSNCRSLQKNNRQTALDFLGEFATNRSIIELLGLNSWRGLWMYQIGKGLSGLECLYRLVVLWLPILFFWRGWSEAGWCWWSYSTGHYQGRRLIDESFFSHWLNYCGVLRNKISSKLI